MLRVKRVRFQTFKSEGGGIISEFGVLLVSEDIEDLILSEVRTTKAKKEQRQNTVTITLGLLKVHGLPECEVAELLQQMIITGKIITRMCKVMESLSVTKENVEIHRKNQS